MQSTLKNFFYQKSTEVIDLTIEEPKPLKVKLVIQNENTPTAMTTKKGKRECPFYKRIPGTSFTMDAFNFGVIPGCSGYFLSHFHSDHFGGLGKKFNQILYCTEITANLVKLRIGVNSDNIVALPLNQSITIQGINVYIIDGNHCPGSGIFIFTVPEAKIDRTFASYNLLCKDLTIVHTGDFRAHPTMLKSIPTNVDFLFLDTTYLNPKYTFPDQSYVIKQIGTIIMDIFHNKAKNTNLDKPNKKQKIAHNQQRLSFGQLPVPPKHTSPFHITDTDNIVICVGSYTIGKEKIAIYLAELLQSKIYLNKEKTKIWNCFNSDKTSSFMSTDFNAKVHVLRMNEINYNFLSQYIKETNFTKVIGIVPTGWTFSDDIWKPSTISHQVCIFSIPYSEHSSYTELEQFTSRLQIYKVQPTVNMSKVKQQLALINSWKSLKTEWTLQQDLFDGKSIA